MNCKFISFTQWNSPCWKQGLIETKAPDLLALAWTMSETWPTYKQLHGKSLSQDATTERSKISLVGRYNVQICYRWIVVCLYVQMQRIIQRQILNL